VLQCDLGIDACPGHRCCIFGKSQAAPRVEFYAESVSTTLLLPVTVSHRPSPSQPLQSSPSCDMLSMRCPKRSSRRFKALSAVAESKSTWLLPKLPLSSPMTVMGTSPSSTPPSPGREMTAHLRSRAYGQPRPHRRTRLPSLISPCGSLRASCP
jgi:hypothetical protein